MDLKYILKNKLKFSGLVIDTNLLLLLLIGSFDADKIGKIKRIHKYTLDDFNKLNLLINHLNNKLFVTQSILTEITNLSSGYNDETSYQFFKFLALKLIDLSEPNNSSLELIDKDKTGFYKFGLTDCSVIDSAKKGCLVVTDDFPLYHYLSSLQLDAINYNQLMLL